MNALVKGALGELEKTPLLKSPQIDGNDHWLPQRDPKGSAQRSHPHKSGMSTRVKHRKGVNIQCIASNSNNDGITEGIELPSAEAESAIACTTSEKTDVFLLCLEVSNTPKQGTYMKSRCCSIKEQIGLYSEWTSRWTRTSKPPHYRSNDEYIWSERAQTITSVRIWDDHNRPIDLTLFKVDVIPGKGKQVILSQAVRLSNKGINTSSPCTVINSPFQSTFGMRPDVGNDKIPMQAT